MVRELDSQFPRRASRILNRELRPGTPTPTRNANPDPEPERRPPNAEPPEPRTPNRRTDEPTNRER
jgi:hypothetical protein